MLGNVKLRHFEAFLALAEDPHFGRAASTLGIAQPALSHQIQALEHILGVTLFERTRRSVVLSPAGAALIPAARRAVASAEQAVNDAHRYSRGETGTIEIMYSASIAYSGVLQEAIGGFRAAFPGVRLNIREGTLERQVTALLESRADIGFMRPTLPRGDGLDSHVIRREKILLLLPAAHPLAQRDTVDLADCRDETFIIPDQPPEVSFHRHTLELCSNAGFVPRIGREVRDWVTITSLVALRMGFALVPASLTCVALPGVAFREIRANNVLADIALVHRSGDQTPPVSAFLRHVRAQFHDADWVSD